MGRPAGVPNKNRRGMEAMLRQQFGEDFNVIMMIAENCKTLHDIAVDSRGTEDAVPNAKAAIDSLDKLAQYVRPKLKAVEVTGEDGEAIKTENKWVVEFVNADPIEDNSSD